MGQSHCVAVAEVFQPEDLIGDACGVEGLAGHMYFLSGVGCWRDYFWIQDVLSKLPSSQGISGGPSGRGFGCRERTQVRKGMRFLRPGMNPGQKGNHP